MAWTEPKTDWSDDDFFTCEDMNRITGNINHLYPAAALKTDYSTSDILTVDDWNAVISALRTLSAALGVPGEPPETETYSAAFNTAESLLDKLKVRYDIIVLNAVATQYCGQVYASEIPEAYSRGV